MIPVNVEILAPMQSVSEARASAWASQAKMSGGIFKTADIAQFDSTHRASETRGSTARCAERLRLSGNALSVVLHLGEA